MFIEGNSCKFNLDHFNLKKFDMILIDGNHLFDFVINDTKLAHKHISSKGVIVWHDYAKPEKYTSIQVKSALDSLNIEPVKINNTSIAYIVATKIRLL